jgi:hypothetical protein
MYNNTKLKMDGVFLDETPSMYDPAAYKYLEKARGAVRNGTRFRDRFIGMFTFRVLYSVSHIATEEKGDVHDADVD